MKDLLKIDPSIIINTTSLFPHSFQKAEKGRRATEKLQDMAVLVSDMTVALDSADVGFEPTAAKQISKKYEVIF